MTSIKILGPGCANCVNLEKQARQAVEQLGLDATIEKVTDYAEIAAMGVVSTPGIVIDGKVVHAGGLPRAEDVAAWLKPACGCSA